MGWVIIATHDELGGHGKFLSSETEGFLGYIVRNAFNLYEYAAWGYGSYESFGSTFTFTHTNLCRLLCDGFVWEDADPDLTLTLHVTCHSDTGGFNLATGDPLRLESLDAERTEGQLVATLRNALGCNIVLLNQLWV